MPCPIALPSFGFRQRRESVIPIKQDMVARWYRKMPARIGRGDRVKIRLAVFATYAG